MEVSSCHWIFFSLWNRMHHRKSMIACKIFIKETFLLMQRSNTKCQQGMAWWTETMEVTFVKIIILKKIFFSSFNNIKNIWLKSFGTPLLSHDIRNIQLINKDIICYYFTWTLANAYIYIQPHIDRCDG